MELVVVYGRSGTGKSSYIYNNIKKEIGNKKIYLVVPEQSNLTAEQKLFKELNVETLMNVEVLTLSRMATRVLDEVGEKTRKLLTKVGKNMIIYDMLVKEKSKLKFLGKSDKNIEIVSNLITEFKKHNITTEFLDNVKIDEQYTKLKVEDIKKIYTKYEEKIQGNLIDENDELTLLYENLDKVDLFQDSIICFDDFLGFTTQEYKIFEKLITQAYKIMVTIPADSLFITKKENDIFYFNKKFANKLVEIATENNIKVTDVFLENNYRTKYNDLKYLEEAFAFNKLKRYKDENANIKLLCADNPYVEIENIAKTIFRLVKEEKYRYKDFLIIAGTVEEYRDDIKTIFSKYDIPVFVDEKKELNQNILIKYIIAMIDIFAKNWSFDSIFNYIKIGLSELDILEICEFENYCLKWGIRNKKWFEKFEYEPVNDKQNYYEDLRKKIIIPLVNFKNKISQNRTVKEITKCLYEFLLQNNINVILDSKIKKINNIEIANEYNTSYKVLVKLLDEIVCIFGDEKISFEKYKEILQVGLNSSELGKIPALQDGVIFGDISRSRGSDVKVEFLIGVNDGKIPSSNKVEGYFNDEDRRILGELGVELAKDSKDNMYEEQFNIYRMLVLPSEKLYISYSSSDKSGEAIRPSILIKKINRIFDLKEEIIPETEITTYNSTFEESLNLYKKFLNGDTISNEEKNLISYFYNKEQAAFKTAISGLNYTNMAEQINKMNITRLYGKTLQTSISKLEQYEGCPFSFHMKYGLKLREKNELQMRSLDTGNFMHEVIDLFFEELKNNNIDIKNIEDEDVENIVVKIIDELFKTSKYYVFSSTSKFKILSRRLKKVVLTSIKYIVYTLQNSKFSVFGNEVEFSKNSEYKPIVVELEDKTKVEITGKIDRVDVGKLNDKEYVRIIDYKSSVKSLDFNKVVAGLQIQLITYLDDICEQFNFNPSGILYMSLIDNIVKAPKNLSNEVIEEEIKKNFRMQGVVLADVEVAKLMDTKLEPGSSSNIIPFAIKKEGTITESRSNTIKAEDFSNLQKKVKKIIKQISREILNGNVEIKPYYYQKSTPCEYCNYKTICCFTPGIKGNDYKYIHKNSKQDVLEQIKEEI